MEEHFKIICPACNRVGQMGCYECGEQYTFSNIIVHNELICVICNSQKLNYYEQNDIDQFKHKNCSNDTQRWYYHCENCQSRLCPCILQKQNNKED